MKNKKVFCLTYGIDCFGLKEEDFDYLKWEDEPVEVFLNLEDQTDEKECQYIDKQYKLYKNNYVVNQ